MELTENEHTDQEDYKRAKNRVKEIKGFYMNLTACLVTIPLLIFINYYTYWQFQWFWFAMLGWGLILVIHAFLVFGYVKSWEEKKIKQMLDREQNTKTNGK